MTKNEIYGKLIDICKGKVKKNEYMSKHTSFKIGGIADFFAEANSINEICLIQEFAKKNNIPTYILGNGSNILVSDDGIRGIVLKIDINTMNFEKKRNS